MHNNGKNPSSHCKWAIMIYMAADDAVAIPQAHKFLAELHELSPLFDGDEDASKIRILLQAYTDWDTDNKGPDFHARRFEINDQFSLDNEINDPHFNKNTPMGDAKALTGFIEWCRKRCEAEKYLLFLWGHGTGSSLFSLEKTYTSILDIYPDLTLTDLESGRRIGITELTDKNSPLFKDKNQVKIKIAFKGNDFYGPTDNIIITKRKTDFYKEKNIDLFDLLPAEEGQVLSFETERIRKHLSTRSNLDGLLEKEIRISLGSLDRKINVLLIMGCCMQMVEFAYELNGKCDYFIASEELIYFEGYNYFDSFSALVDYPDMDAPTLAKRIVQEAPIKQTYNEFEKHSLAIACVDLRKNQKLASLIDEFAETFLKINGWDKWKKIRKARSQCRHFGEDAYTYSFIDITWFFKKLVVQLNTDVYDDLHDLVETIIDYLENNYIVQTWIGSKRTPSFKYYRSYGGHGVGIYFPESREAHKNNAELGIYFDKSGDPNEFTKANAWNKLIFQYMDENQIVKPYPPGSPEPEDNQTKYLKEDNFLLKKIVSDLQIEIGIMKAGK